MAKREEAQRIAKEAEIEATFERSTSTPDMIVIEEKTQALSRQRPESVLTSSKLMDGSSAKALGHDVSFISSVSLVGGLALEAEANESMQDTFVEATPKPSPEPAVEDYELPDKVDSKPYTSCCSQVTCLPCISKKSGQAPQGRRLSLVPLAPVRTSNLHDES